MSVEPEIKFQAPASAIQNRLGSNSTALVLTMPDNELRLCAARLHKFYDLTKLDYKMFRMRWKWSACLSNIVYFKLLCYSK